MMEIPASWLAPMRRHAPKPDEADKTVMGASCTGSYEVTDVPPGDVQGRGHPGRSTNLQQQSVGQSESQTHRVTPSAYILTVSPGHHLGPALRRRRPVRRPRS